MAQSFTDNPYSQPTVADSTLGQLENNDLALKSGFSGGSNPSNAVAGMPHMRTGGAAGAGDGLRVRNAVDDAWIKILTGDADQKMWVYRNNSGEGWLIDATVTDRVLSLKGGTEDYNVNGGTNAGSWTLAHAHEVKLWLDAYWVGEAPTYVPASRHTNVVSSNTPNKLDGGVTRTAQSAPMTEWSQDAVSKYSDDYQTIGSYTHKYEHGIWGDSEDSTDNDWRPAAAVGTLQYPDLS